MNVELLLGSGKNRGMKRYENMKMRKMWKCGNALRKFDNLCKMIVFATQL